MKRFTGSGLILLGTVLLTGCSGWPGRDEGQLKSPSPPVSDRLVEFGETPEPLFDEPPDFAGLSIPLASAAPLEPADEKARFRFRAMREAAISWGSQAGFHRRMWEIQLMLTERNEVMDSVFDFNRIAWPTPNGTGMIIPPVVQRSGAVWTGGEGGQSASAADAFFEIQVPARIAPTLPSWRDYLVFAPAAPKPVIENLRPREEELPQWREWAAEGWNAGRKQADEVFEEGMARLERDFRGMLEYRRLSAQKMVSDLSVDSASYQLGAEEDGRIMRVGERGVRITDPVRLIGDSTSWQPRILTASPH